MCVCHVEYLIGLCYRMFVVGKPSFSRVAFNCGLLSVCCGYGLATIRTFDLLIGDCCCMTVIQLIVPLICNQLGCLANTLLILYICNFVYGVLINDTCGLSVVDIIVEDMGSPYHLISQVSHLEVQGMCCSFTEATCYI